MNEESKNGSNKLWATIKQWALPIFAIVIALLSVCYAYEANEHTKIIEQATLKVGLGDFTNDSLHIPLVNGYYARYPAQLTSATYYYNETVIHIPIGTQKGEYKLVERDKGCILTLKLPDVNNVSDGEYNIALEIRYVDFSEIKLKSIDATYKIVFSNHSIVDADLINVDEKYIRDIE